MKLTDEELSMVLGDVAVGTYQCLMCAIVSARGDAPAADCREGSPGRVLGTPWFAPLGEFEWRPDSALAALEARGLA